MEELIAVIFAILVFVGPMLLRFLGSLFEDSNDSAKPAVKNAPNKRNEFAEQLRRHREQQERNMQPVEAEVVADVVPIRSLSDSSKGDRDAYYNEKQQLADEIQTRDDHMDSHLHETFDHSLGGLNTGIANQVQEDVLRTEEAAAASQPSLAAGIAAMLQNKQEVRQAFILGEILQRPPSIDRR